MTVERRTIGIQRTVKGNRMSVLSYDTTKHWKTKLHRISVRSAAQPQGVFNNLGHLLSEEMLIDIFHGLRGNKAVGIDGTTKEKYGKELSQNISKLLSRIRRGSYKPSASRVVKIPKASGGTRPLAISCFEDKLVQTAVKRILEAVYEPLFKDVSHGFRPRRSCHTALRSLSENLYSLFSGSIVEIDIKKCFDTIPHDKLFEIIEQKVQDKRFVRLLEKLVRAPIKEENGRVDISRIGCPQGSSLSPLLCNIYLDHVLDKWFEDIQVHFNGKKQNQIRYCDDAIWIFAKDTDAQRFYQVLPKRLEKYGLSINKEKSGIIRAGSRYSEFLSQNKRRAKVFKFLGFNVYWCRSYTGPFRARFKSHGKSLSDILGRIKVYLKEHLNTKDFKKFLRDYYSRIKGWMKYHAISGNQERVSVFLQICQRLLHRWWNRRSQRSYVVWNRFSKILKRLKFPSAPNVYRLYNV